MAKKWKKAKSLIGTLAYAYLLVLLLFTFAAIVVLLPKATQNQAIGIVMMAACALGIIAVIRKLYTRIAARKPKVRESKASEDIKRIQEEARAKVAAEANRPSYTISIETTGKHVARTAEPKDATVKGKLLYRLPSQYTVVDLETTGFSCVKDRIIEVAALRVRDGEVVEEFQSLVRCPYEITAKITHLTGITNEMLADAPSLEDVLPDFLRFIGNDLLMGHYLSFDIRFLNVAAKELGLQEKAYKYVDTMYLARKLFPAWEHHRLEDLVTNLKVESGEAHRALGDTYRTKKCYDALREEIAARGLTEADL